MLISITLFLSAGDTDSEKLVNSFLSWLSDGGWAKNHDPKLKHNLVDDLESTYEVLFNQCELWSLPISDTSAGYVESKSCLS